MWVAGVLLIIPMIAIGAVPLYAKQGPQLGSFPFFIWYQFLWVFLTAACTTSAHALVKRARRDYTRTPAAAEPAVPTEPADRAAGGTR